MRFERLKRRPETKYGQFLRSILASNLSFLLDFGLCLVFVEAFGIDYLIATAMSFAAGNSLNYLLSILWIFESDTGKRKIEFTAYLLVSFVGLGLNTLGMYLFTSLAGLYFLYSRLISSAMVFLFNYFCKKYLVFHWLKRWVRP
jgi:putative flippase GtrA